MCDPVSNTTDLTDRIASIRDKVEDLRINHPLVYAAANPLIEDLLAWLNSADAHIRALHKQIGSKD